ncbi:LOW QUALITY PROTEIN: wall-associated receptor kinase-like 8 [Pistacia vera]|uniref:LOW QUALITY PROTEIN: wall-associated receptor kinase-like 8 n=1 Tax=Pistacia vera TaxID=55513 RepID=UPI001262FEDB|nr:LOW QUALITY PROTEIN: wall-associated receptor kinase-like 8 [Pistacia vera]
MALQYIIFQQFSLFLLGTVSVYANFGYPALPNCPNQCGNVTISYPFGIGSGCSKDESFSIICSTSFNPPKPLLTNPQAEILEINLPGGSMRVNSEIYSSCSGLVNISKNLGDNPYLFYPENGNRFTALGCGVQATISENNELIGGCMSICNDESHASSSSSGASCYGITCCQAMIPYGLKNFTLSVSGTNKDGSYETCKYAFLVDQDWFLNQTFSYPFYYMPSDLFPVVLDWKFSANETCKICGPNAICSVNQSFVSCSCAKGFAGNPYLPQGCTDVDECEDVGLNDCVKICVNTLGNYQCCCPSGYSGDGRRGGIGCVENKQWVRTAIIGASAGLGLLLVILGALWLTKYCKKEKALNSKEKFFKRNGGLLLQQKLSSNEGSVEKTKLFTSTELEIATNMYNQNRIIGQGGQGTVYKGMLSDGRNVAVKMSKVIDKAQLEQFINEVVILSQINHRNVVELLGCCLETEVPLLVYEFIPNGTLYHAIQYQTEGFPFSWEIRLRVATEVASAIAYLHASASVLIYHRDVQSSNILLDEKLSAKLSDFGTSKSVSLDITHLTTQVKGTFGYLDPEYFRSNQVTKKSDVYSFEVVMVKLMTRQKPIFLTEEEENISLVAYFISSLDQNNLIGILDAQVMKEDRKEELMAVAYIAKRCLYLNGRDRPSMREVAMELEGIMISKGYLSTDQKQDITNAKMLTEIGECSSISTGTYSLMCSESSKDVHSLKLHTI